MFFPRVPALEKAACGQQKQQIFMMSQEEAGMMMSCWRMWRQAGSWGRGTGAATKPWRMKQLDFPDGPTWPLLPWGRGCVPDSLAVFFPQWYHLGLIKDITSSPRHGLLYSPCTANRGRSLRQLCLQGSGVFVWAWSHPPCSHELGCGTCSLN